MYPLETNRDVRNLKWQYKVRNVPEKRLPAMVDRAVWEKITNGRAETRCYNVVEKIWKDLGGDPRRGVSTEKFGGYKSKILEERERLELRNKVEEEKHLEIYGGLREDIGMKTYPHGPMDYAKKLLLRFRVGDLDLS